MTKSYLGAVALFAAVMGLGACVPQGTNLPDATPQAGQTGGDSTPVAQAQVEVIPSATPIPTAPAAARVTYTVERGTVQEVFEFRGRWLPRDQIQLSFEVAGTVRRVEVQRDDTVTAGTLLADLQIDDLEAQLQTQQLTLDTAKRNLSNSGDTEENSVTNAQFTLANSQLSLQSSKATLPWTSVQDAKDNVEKAERAAENAQRSYDDLVSRPDSAASAVDSAYEQVVSARESLEQARRGYQSAVASYYSASIGIKQAENSVLQNEIALQNAVEGGGNADGVEAVQSAQLAVDQTRKKIAQSSLYAPIDGVILEITIAPGDAVTAYKAVITMAIPEPKESIAQLAFNDIQQLAVGQLGVCNVLNQPETAVQCVVRQLPISNRDADQTVRVAASLENVQNGQLIEVTMPLEVKEDVLWLPPAALNEFQDRTYVVLLTAEGERVRDVEIGLQTDERVEITSGVEEGDIVVQQ
jgi:multidrug resistance efflux pump